MDSKAQHEYTPPTYTQDGFTHLTADPNLLLKVANHFYKDTQGDWLLIILDPGKLASKVVFEPAAPVGQKSQSGLDASGEGKREDSGPLFPHLYGPINHEAVVSELPVQRAPEDGTFLSIPGLL